MTAVRYIRPVPTREGPVMDVRNSAVMIGAEEGVMAHRDVRSVIALGDSLGMVVAKQPVMDTGISRVMIVR